MRQTASLSTIPDTASFLGLSVEELQKVIDRGSLPIVLPSTEPLIHEADLEAWLRRSMLGEGS
jgi:hypothetical protein